MHLTENAAQATDVTRLVRERALALGFDVVGFARADEPIDDAHAKYVAFVARGMHGEMSYLEEASAARLRLDGPTILEGAKSVVCVGRRYGRSDRDEAEDAPLARSIARYARGQDYHNHLRKRLRKLATFIRTLGPGVRARPLCDVEPVLERAWASRAGIGFVGKNGLVITPGQGSYQLLGEVVTTLALVPSTPIAERCGACTRCLDACPTSAFVAPFVLDPRRCIAYVTIEAQTAPAADLRDAAGEHLFGCDACQEACPFNRAAPPPADETLPFRPLARWSEIGLDDLVTASEERWEELSRGTPLRRAGRAGLARNATLMAARAFVDATDPGARAEARSILEAAAKHDEALVRSIAEDALEGKTPPEAGRAGR